jgi:hypothetical protein
VVPHTIIVFVQPIPIDHLKNKPAYLILKQTILLWIAKRAKDFGIAIQIMVRVKMEK